MVQIQPGFEPIQWGIRHYPEKSVTSTSTAKLIRYKRLNLISESSYTRLTMTKRSLVRQNGDRAALTVA